MDKMEIYPMTEHDIAQIEQIERESFSDPWSRQALAAELENPLAVYFVCRQGESVLGYVGMHSILGEGYITNIAVQKQQRRKKVGTALMRAMLAWAKETDHSFVTLEVRTSNLAAQSLYSNFGFQRVGKRKNYYQHPQEDALIMTLEMKKNSI